MAQPFEVLHFREIFGRTLRRYETGFDQAFTVAPIKPDDPPGESRRVVESVRHQLVEVLDYGEMFYVSAEICQFLVEELVARMDTKRVFHFEPGDFPTRIGMVYFDTSLIQVPTILTKSGTQALRALLWGQLATHPADDDTYLVPGSYSDSPEVNDIGKVVYSVVDSIKQGQWKDRRFERSQAYRQKNEGPWVMRHWIPIPYHQRFGADTLSTQIDNTTWGQGELTEEEKVEDADGAAAAVGLILRLCLAWTAFMQTEIVGTHSLDSRDHDKVLSREGRPPAQVRIVVLRRYASAPEIKHMVDVNWQYRWKVREHYRNQRVGPGRSMIRRTLVREHWKGPEDKPQAHQDTIQSLQR